MRALPPLWLLVVLGCDPEPCEGSRDLAATPLGLELTAGEHPTGWGDGQCFLCHQAFATHLEPCTSVDGVDLRGIYDAAAEGDPAICVTCHGDNGTAAAQ